MQNFVKILQIIYKLIQNYGKLSKIIQASEFLGSLLQMLMKVGLQLIENVLQLLANFLSMRAAQIKDRAYSINLDEHKSIRTYRINLYVNGNNVTYFIVLELWTFQNKFKMI